MVKEKIICKTFDELFPKISHDNRLISGLIESALTLEEITEADLILGLNEKEEYVKVFKNRIEISFKAKITWEKFEEKDLFPNYSSTLRNKIIVKNFKEHFMKK